MSIQKPEINHFKSNVADSLNSTLKIMRELERVALSEEIFVKYIRQTFKSNCQVCQLKQVWQYVRKNFEYIDDSYDEFIISPAVIISKRFGDCDDFALFIHTALKALGIESKYILLGTEKNKPSHIAVYALKKVIDGTNDKWNHIPDKYKFYSLV